MLSHYISYEIGCGLITIKTQLKSFWTKLKQGTTLVELVIVMVVITIITLIAVGGTVIARDKAAITSTSSDLKAYENALRQTFMFHPEVMKFKDTTTVSGKDVADVVLEYVNEQLESEWKFTNEFDTNNSGELMKGEAATSGAIAYSLTKRDAWGKPYTLYMFTDTHDTAYGLSQESSCMYLVVASSGKNSSGVGTGFGGDNFNETTGNLLKQDDAVLNTDGIDDVGVIIRILDGDIYSATFGFSEATLGTLKGLNWIFGGDSDKSGSATVGIYYDADAQSPSEKTFTAGTDIAGSLDKYKTISSINADETVTDVVGSWS